MRLGALPSIVAILDVLLGVVPCPTGVGQEVRHELSGQDRGSEEGAKGEVVDPKADDDRGQNRQQGRSQQLTQGGGGADIDHRPVVGATFPSHDGAVGELPPHLLDHHSCRATHRSDGQTGEHECDRATDEEANESGRIGDVDRRLRQGEQL